jgi:hypothetical protein
MTGEQPTVAHGVVGDTAERPAVSPAAADRAGAGANDPYEQRPEAFVAAAFAGGFVLAKLIGRLRR